MKKSRTIIFTIGVALILVAVGLVASYYFEPTTDYSTADKSTIKSSYKNNKDMVAWLSIPNTPIDYPVAQAEDNSYYLTHDFNKAYDPNGTPFLDSRCDSDFMGFNSIIYAHNIDTGTMFHCLVNFHSQDYFDSHSHGSLYIGMQKYRVDFIACDVVESDDFAYNVKLNTAEDKQEFIEDIFKKAYSKKSGINKDKLKDKKLLTLSTCSYEFNDARTVLFGVIKDR